MIVLIKNYHKYKSIINAENEIKFLFSLKKTCFLFLS